MATRRQQLSLGLETSLTSPTEAPADEAILQALADLLLEAYGQETPYPTPDVPVETDREQ